MDYEMEELVPIVGKLAEKYTSHESTSITYEKAEQLMGAVLYCIHELWESSGNAPSLNKKLSAQRAYEMGAAYVRDKTGKALDLYNRILPEFCHYENKCLYDTFVKGIPEFFKWYDVQFEPQNTILTLDYPLLKDISEYTGIDKIFEFIKAIGLEQKFLKLFPAGYVINILSKDNRNWQESMDNICEIVFIHVIGHIILGKSLTVIELEEDDYSYMQKIFKQATLEDIKKQLTTALEIFIKNYYENDRELLNYLSGAISGIVVRLKNAADNKVLGNII
ncbi:DUF6179 domain-containing protein [Mediterraneibacter glycyrrhizinilyticus]|jgi:hypothetical protein|uniref:DUF6179 domain-containing protein n=1 Tax=Mediterraneibacter glycyrrhizinilyticus TaxID=342942 RepID=UPI0025A4138E|nr:DUF6179 domain-containing protein [Mediterraneibacter glycyrrhizinilyticus]MDM8211024.1 DUF6179 domain-containing protein [Mediterraneibacter glycyrrhizinilyticus]MDN0062038.1 DUF6179 domain-containing protein [Mediterraneibacter glycyrrhizinilyticus]